MKNRLLSLFLLTLSAFTSRGQVARITCSESLCGPESLKPSSGYAVVCPVGSPTVEPVVQAPRLESLNGKTIAITGVSFMTEVIHPEICRLIKQNYPDARVLTIDEVGIAGVYPAPGIRRKSKEEFQARLKEYGVDAVIAGNGGCGLCTPKETGSCIAAEYMGIPSVLVAGPGFVEQARCTAMNNGIQVLRVAEYPGAFSSHTHEELLDNTRQVLWPRIVEALTRPIAGEEVYASSSAATENVRDDVFYGTLDEVNEYFREMNWSDGLPIVPPTFEKVSSFLDYTDMKWDDTVAVLPVAHRNTMVWHVAVNGVMAGCRPEYMPILIAMTKALGAPQFRRTLASTHGWIPYSWLNGPVARQLGIDCGQGQINETANMALGRYMNLALMNLAGYYVKQDRMGTFGYPMSWCMVEDDAACMRIGWKPYHVRNGYGINENTITVASTLMWGNNMAPSTGDPYKLMELIAWDMSERCQFALGSGKQYTYRTVLMTEPVASILAKSYRSPEHLERDLVENAGRPVKSRAFARYYANPGSSKDNGQRTLRHFEGYITRAEDARMTQTPQWYAASDPEILTVPVVKEGMTAFLVTGDPSRNKVQTMPGGGYSTIKIELPSNWNKLMEVLGYGPIKEYFL